MAMGAESLCARAVACLHAADPADKIALSAATADWWRARSNRPIGAATPPARPGRPARPALVAPGAVARRKITADTTGRVALLHALAHIELNAVDLAWDIIARFAATDPPRAFFDDWVGVARDEALHFGLLTARLAELGAAYGDLAAHDSLWGSALATADSLTARLAIVPLVLEARGLDVTPAMVARLNAVGDTASAAVLQRIHDDEIGHVAVGKRWFDWCCERDGVDPRCHWRYLVESRFSGTLKPPFNHDSRARAGLPANWYEPAAGPVG